MSTEADRRAERVAHVEMLRDRDRQDARELTAFVEVVAGHFRCPRMAEHNFRIRLKAAFEDLSHLALTLGREG